MSIRFSTTAELSFLIFSKQVFQGMLYRQVAVKRVQIFQTEKTIEIKLFKPTEVCGKGRRQNSLPLSAAKHFTIKSSFSCISWQQLAAEQGAAASSILTSPLKYKVRKMVKSLLKHHYCCPMLLMQTTKTAISLQTKAIYHHFYVF